MMQILRGFVWVAFMSGFIFTILNLIKADWAAAGWTALICVLSVVVDEVAKR